MNLQATKLEVIEKLLEIESEESLAKIKEFILAEARIYPFSDDHKEVLDARLKEHTLNPEEGISWKELKKQLK